MGKNTDSGLPKAYPHLWRWVVDFGTMEIGHCAQTRSFIRVQVCPGVMESLEDLLLICCLLQREGDQHRPQQ